MTEKLRIIEVGARDELYCQYDGQCQPQPVYVEIDPEERTLAMGYNSNIGSGQPEAVAMGRLLRTELPDGIVPTEASANAMMHDLLDEATALADSYTERWDGSNYVGRWDTEQKNSWDYRLFNTTGDIEQVQVWNAADWFADELYAETAARYGITADTTDEDLYEISCRMDEKETCDELDVLEYSESYCEKIRDYLREQRDED